MDTTEQPFLPVGFETIKGHNKADNKKIKVIRNKLGPAWEYHNVKDIEYRDNELGYRSRTVIPKEKYGIVLGCSHTYGLYLEEQHRYSNILEDSLNTSIINLGICGGSANAIHLNLCNLLYSNYVLPEFVVIQWPSYQRYVMFDTVPHARPLRIRQGGPFNNIFEQLLKEGNSVKNMSDISCQLTKKMIAAHCIHLIDFTLVEEEKDFYNCTYIKKCDTAMDNQHIGKKTNQLIAEFIQNELR